MAKKVISSGIAHTLPPDLRTALSSDTAALERWEDLTSLARNEWICWCVSVKRDETRKLHVQRTISELKNGIRRPCCWIGCIHRKDKKLSPSVSGILQKKFKNYK